MEQNDNVQDLGSVEVASASLNFADKRERSVNASAERVKISASNGNSFNVSDNNKITLVIAANQQNSFLDMMSTYLKLTIKNSHGANIKLDGNRGGYGLFKQVEVLSGSSVISQINDYDCVIDQMAAISLNNEYRAGFGFTTQGLSTSVTAETGEDIQNGDERVLCLPLYGLPLYQEKLVPLFGRSEIRINLYLNAPARAFKAAAAIANTAVTVESPELVAYQVRVNNDVMDDLFDENGGVFEIMTQDIQTIPQSVAVADRSLVSNLGFSFSSLNKITFGYYPTTLSTVTTVSSNRDKRNLTEFNLLVNGSKYPKNPVQVSTNAAEAMMELAIANKAMADTKFEPSIDPDLYILQAAGAAGAADNSVGQFVASLDLEALREHSDTSLYSGLSTVGATTALQQTFNADGNTTDTLVVVGYFEKSIILDMNGSQTFRISQ